jgi:hypothetical protein
MRRSSVLGGQAAPTEERALAVRGDGGGGTAAASL